MLIDIKKVKIIVTVPLKNVEDVRKAMCEAGAGVMEIILFVQQQQKV